MGCRIPIWAQKGLILAGHIRLRSWPNIGDSYGMMYVFPLDLDHLEPAPSKPGAAKRVRLSLSPGTATPPGSEVYILGHIY